MSGHLLFRWSAIVSGIPRRLLRAGRGFHSVDPSLPVRHGFPCGPFPSVEFRGQVALSQNRGVASSASARGEASETVLQFIYRQIDDAERYFSELARKASDRGFQRIFDMLASDEAKRRKWVDEFAEKSELGQLAKVTSIPEGSQNVFELIQADGLDLTADIVEQVDLYKAVRDILEQSRDWYLDRALETRDSKVKALFRTIAEQEEVHLKVIDELLAFVGEQEVNQNPRWSG
eukprot:RCo044493